MNAVLLQGELINIDKLIHVRLTNNFNDHRGTMGYSVNLIYSDNYKTLIPIKSRMVYWDFLKSLFVQGYVIPTQFKLNSNNLVADVSKESFCINIKLLVLEDNAVYNLQVPTAGNYISTFKYEYVIKGIFENQEISINVITKERINYEGMYLDREFTEEVMNTIKYELTTLNRKVNEHE